MNLQKRQCSCGNNLYSIFHFFYPGYNRGTYQSGMTFGGVRKIFTIICSIEAQSIRKIFIFTFENSLNQYFFEQKLFSFWFFFHDLFPEMKMVIVRTLLASISLRGSLLMVQKWYIFFLLTRPINHANITQNIPNEWISEILINSYNLIFLRQRYQSNCQSLLIIRDSVKNVLQVCLW